MGATKVNVQSQFLFEAILLTVLGGLIGIAIGVGISLVVAIIARYLGYNWAFVITPASVIVGVGVSGLVGIIFGWYPARRAANFDPVVALRYE